MALRYVPITQPQPVAVPAQGLNAQPRSVQPQPKTSFGQGLRGFVGNVISPFTNTVKKGVEVGFSGADVLSGKINDPDYQYKPRTMSQEEYDAWQRQSSEDPLKFFLGDAAGIASFMPAAKGASVVGSAVKGGALSGLYNSPDWTDIDQLGTDVAMGAGTGLALGVGTNLIGKGLSKLRPSNIQKSANSAKSGMAGGKVGTKINTPQTMKDLSSLQAKVVKSLENKGLKVGSTGEILESVDQARSLYQDDIGTVLNGADVGVKKIPTSKLKSQVFAAIKKEKPSILKTPAGKAALEDLDAGLKTSKNYSELNKFMGTLDESAYKNPAADINLQTQAYVNRKARRVISDYIKEVVPKYKSIKTQQAPLEQFIKSGNYSTALKESQKPLAKIPWTDIGIGGRNTIQKTGSGLRTPLTAGAGTLRPVEDAISSVIPQGLKGQTAKNIIPTAIQGGLTQQTPQTSFDEMGGEVMNQGLTTPEQEGLPSQDGLSMRDRILEDYRKSQQPPQEVGEQATQGVGSDMGQEGTDGGSQAEQIRDTVLMKLLKTAKPGSKTAYSYDEAMNIANLITKQATGVDVGTLQKDAEASQKGAELTADQRNFLSSSIGILDQIDQFEAMRNKIGYAEGLGARGGGLLKSVGASLLGNDPDVRVYNNMRQAFISNIAKGVGSESGVLTDPDVARALAAMPAITDTKAESEAKFKLMKSLVENKRKSIISGDYLKQG